MTNNNNNINGQHPMTPSPELVRQLRLATASLDSKDYMDGPNYTDRLIIASYRAGADHELEACCEWIAKQYWAFDFQLHAARRPQPKSLAEEALEEVGAFEGMGTCNIDIIRRALERLQELEEQGDG